MDEVSVASEYLPGLRDRTRHSVSLSVWGDNGPVVVRWDYGAYPLPINVRVGATMPLLPSAVGRVFLAYLPESVTGPVLTSQYEPDEENPLDEVEIEQVKATVRGEGRVAFTSGTLIPGVDSLAAPVTDRGLVLPLVVCHRAAEAGGDPQGAAITAGRAAGHRRGDLRRVSATTADHESAVRRAPV